MIIFGLLLAAVLVGGTAYFAGQAIKAAHESGKLATTPRTGARTARAKTAARNAPHNARTIFAQAYADNWAAKRAHAREAKTAASPSAGWPGEPSAGKPSGRTVLRRLVAPPGSPQAAPPPAVPSGAPAASTNGHRPGAASPGIVAPSAAARPAARPRLVPVPSPPTGRPAMSSAPPSAAPTGAAADMFSAANILNGHARGGGIHAKLRATRVYEEAYSHLEQGLLEMARDMQEHGEYPAMVWEPVLTAAAHVKAASMAMGESSNAITSIMNMPVGELAASPVHAPHHDELNRA